MIKSLAVHQKGCGNDEVVAARRHVQCQSKSDDATQAAEPQDNLVTEPDLCGTELIHDAAEGKDVHASGYKIETHLQLRSVAIAMEERRSLKDAFGMSIRDVRGRHTAATASIMTAGVRRSADEETKPM